MLGLKNRCLSLFCLCVVLIPLTSALSACDAANDLVTGSTTTDPEALLMSEVAGHGSAGLETALIGAGLLTEIPAGSIPTEALSVVEVALNTLISSCLTFQAIDTGISTGFEIQFADGGCGIPLTNFKLQGGFRFETAATDATSEWIINFTDFQVAGVFVDGLINITTKDQSNLDFNIVNLDVSYNSFSANVNLTGSLVTESSHTDITFNGVGAVIYKGTTYAFTATDIERHTKTDCYPEKGAISITIKDAQGNEKVAGIAFEDLVLDSDDSGKVYVNINGTQHTAKLPQRLCDAF